MRNSSLLIFIIFLVHLMAAPKLFAASLSFSNGALQIKGEIAKGDSENLAKYLILEPDLLFIDIDSPGGDLAEALRIAALIEGAQLDVAVQKGGHCVSSCFFVYLAGLRRDARGVDIRTKMPDEPNPYAGYIGVHRPYLRTTDGTMTSVERQELLMAKVSNMLEDSGVPRYLIDEMMNRPSNDIYWLNTNDIEKLGQFRPGIEESLIKHCGYARPEKIYDDRWGKDRLDKLWSCASEHIGKTRLPIRMSYANKLKSGWRPWGGQ